jgi:hypothetical protein
MIKRPKLHGAEEGDDLQIRGIEKSYSMKSWQKISQI